MNKEKKNVDALVASTLVDLIRFLNREEITKEDIIQIFCSNKGEYIAVIYK